ncbi:MAG: hypothetical protein IJ419_07750 [Agathobacter sp.]|nr:hypothetical protein [Agathobacter sp.]
MKRKDDVFRYLGQILIIFGLSVVILSILSYLVGDSAKSISTMFALGNQGLGLPTLAQFFLLSVLITTLRFILFSDGLISRIPLTVRTFLMFFLIILLIALFVWLFGWFPVDMLEAWGYFFICFAACSFISTYIMIIKTDSENKQMEEALKKLKEEE